MFTVKMFVEYYCAFWFLSRLVSFFLNDKCSFAGRGVQLGFNISQTVCKNREKSTPI